MRFGDPVRFGKCVRLFSGRHRTASELCAHNELAHLAQQGATAISKNRLDIAPETDPIPKPYRIAAAKASKIENAATATLKLSSQRTVNGYPG